MIPIGILASQSGAPGPPPPPVVPTVVTNSVMWMDAADLSTITESSGSVSQWNNKGSLGNFTQASGALQPTTGASTLNGLNVLDFAADYLTAANTNEWKFLHDGTKYVLVAVHRQTTANSGRFFGNDAVGGAERGASFYLRGSNQNPAHDIRNFPVTSSAVCQNRPTTPNVGTGYSVFSVIGDPSQATAADKSELFINDGAALKANTITSSVSTDNPTRAAQIGASGNDMSPLTGSIAEIVVVSGTDATEANRIIIRDYLNAKWGVYV